MQYIVYSKPDCIFCDKAKDLLNSKSLEYTEYVMGVHLTRAELLEQFPSAKTLPIILTADGQMIGGSAELTDYLQKSESKYA